VNEDVVPVVEPIRSLKISLLEIYPFASDKDLILTLEEQMTIQEKNTKETERTAINLVWQGTLSATRPTVIILAVAPSIILLVVIFLSLCLVNQCRRSSRLQQSPIVNIENTANQPPHSTQPSTKDDLGSLQDLLKEFSFNKFVKQ
jgi:hypothetical protein